MKSRCAHLLWSIFLLHSASVWAQDVTAIVSGTLIDGTGSSPQQNTIIVIRGNRIESIRTDGKVPNGARVIDATDKFIVPGLWDKHLHYKDWFPGVADCQRGYLGICARWRAVVARPERGRGEG